MQTSQQTAAQKPNWHGTLKHWYDTLKQTRISLALKTATIIAVVITVFYTDLTLIFTNALQNETANYVVFVPIIILYFLYLKRQMLRAVMPLQASHQLRNTRSLTILTGVLLALTAMLLYWSGSYTLTPFWYHVPALPLFTSGLVLILFNPETLRQLALPIIVLLLLFPPPSTLIRNITLLIIAALYLTLISMKIFKNRALSKKPTCPNPYPQPDRNYCRECGRIFHPPTSQLSKTDAAKIAAIILIAALITTLQTPQTQHFVIRGGSPIILTSTLSGQQSNRPMLPKIDQYSLSFLYRDSVAEARLHLDLALYYIYIAMANLPLNQIVATIEMSPDASRLPSYTPAAREILLPKYSDNISSLGAYYFVYQSDDYKLHAILSLNTSVPFTVDQKAQQRYIELILSASPSGLSQLPTAKQQLITMANLTLNYWEQSEPWSAITLSISQHNTVLLTATSAVLIATIVLFCFETRRQRRISLAAASKLNALDAEIVKALGRTRKPATLMHLCTTIQGDTGQTITPEQLETRLTELENVGIIKTQIISQNDIPIQTWKI